MFYIDLFQWLKWKLRAFFRGCYTDELWTEASITMETYFYELSDRVGYDIKPIIHRISGDIFYLQDLHLRAPDSQWFGLYSLYNDILDYLELADKEVTEENVYTTFNKEYMRYMKSAPNKFAIPFLSFDGGYASFLVDERYFAQ